MADTIHAPVLIIGSGPAGYTAAVYTARASLSPMLVTGMEPGGQMTITTDVENYPGFADVVQGPWLMDKFKGFGVSACATCDGFFYRGKEVAVVGGGNTAVEEALYLTNHATRVTLIHRRDSLRAEKILQERLFAHEKIDVIWDSAIEEVVGDTDPLGATGIRIRNVKTDAITELAVDGLFIAIGHDPATKLFRGHVDIDDEGYINTAPDSTATSVPGVFAAGDVQDKTFRQAVTAAGTGCMAALEAEKFIAEHAGHAAAAE